MFDKARTSECGALIHHLSSLIKVAPEIARAAERLFNQGNFIPPFWKGKTSQDPLVSRQPRQVAAGIEPADQCY